MHNPAQYRLFRSQNHAQKLRIAILLATVLAILGLQSAHAQSFTVVHSFTGGGDGYTPWAGLTIDHAGNFYGSTYENVPDAAGTIFQMKKSNGSWVLNTLANFEYYNPGPTSPEGRPVFGPDGALYATSFYGGNGTCTELGCGTIFMLQPSGSICRSISCPWNVNTYSFTGFNGFEPAFVDPVFDASGNMYGTSTEGGVHGFGNVFKITRSSGGWTTTSLHDFNVSDGSYPQSSLILDAQGNIYGTVWMGGPSGRGEVFELTNSGSGWTYESLYTFPNSSDGSNPVGGLVFDSAGNLYGSTFAGGVNGGGTIFELSPTQNGWNFAVLYSFTGSGYNPGPFDTLTLDPAGNLYGTAYLDGTYGDGSVFKLTHNSNGTWTFTDLHDFTGGADGSNPIGSVSLDASGNIYGTASGGGLPHCNHGCGTVWEITP